MTLAIEFDACPGAVPLDWRTKVDRPSEALEPECVECMRRTCAHPQAGVMLPAIRYSLERNSMYCVRRMAAWPENA